MRTKTESIAGLLEAIERAKQQKDFNILKDLKELRGKFGKVQKRDYLALLDKLMEKYSTDEAAVIHAALLKNARPAIWTQSGCGRSCRKRAAAARRR